LTKEEIIQLYVKKYGKNAQDVLNWLGREQPFITAIETELGQEIMSSHIDMANESFNRFRSLIPENEDITKLNAKTIIALAEYNTCLRIIQKVTARINKFNKTKIDG
jgi:hypothetical protein